MSHNTLLAVTPPITPPTVNNNNKPPTGGTTPPIIPGNNTSTGTQTVIPPIKDPFGGKTLSGVANQAITILLSLIVIAAVVVIIVAGFRMVAGGGNPDQIAKAKKAILWAIIGIVVAFMSFGIVQIVQSLL